MTEKIIKNLDELEMPEASHSSKKEETGGDQEKNGMRQADMRIKRALKRLMASKTLNDLLGSSVDIEKITEGLETKIEIARAQNDDEFSASCQNTLDAFKGFIRTSLTSKEKDDPLGDKADIIGRILEPGIGRGSKKEAAKKEEQNPNTISDEQAMDVIRAVAHEHPSVLSVGDIVSGEENDKKTETRARDEKKAENRRTVGLHIKNLKGFADTPSKSRQVKVDKYINMTLSDATNNVDKNPEYLDMLEEAYIKAGYLKRATGEKVGREESSTEAKQKNEQTKKEEKPRAKKAEGTDVSDVETVRGLSVESDIGGENVARESDSTERKQEAPRLGIQSDTDGVSVGEAAKPENEPRGEGDIGSKVEPGVPEGSQASIGQAPSPIETNADAPKAPEVPKEPETEKAEGTNIGETPAINWRFKEIKDVPEGDLTVAEMMDHGDFPLFLAQYSNGEHLIDADDVEGVREIFDAYVYGGTVVNGLKRTVQQYYERSAGVKFSPEELAVIDEYIMAEARDNPGRIKELGQEVVIFESLQKENNELEQEIRKMGRNAVTERLKYEIAALKAEQYDLQQLESGDAANSGMYHMKELFLFWKKDTPGKRNRRRLKELEEKISEMEGTLAGLEQIKDSRKSLLEIIEPLGKLNELAQEKAKEQLERMMASGDPEKTYAYFERVSDAEEDDDIEMLRKIDKDEVRSALDEKIEAKVARDIKKTLDGFRFGAKIGNVENLKKSLRKHLERSGMGSKKGVEAQENVRRILLEVSRELGGGAEAKAKMMMVTAIFNELK
ncbi:MAG: hypothetical protein A3G52_04760 [Candidatus Taylorbacteria bacterium RIFCSPLOWO2_12_FULL_43_20]|uniref:Uncharacterized protein n=1 Tax=Candidatus Taylorbacteria bacterium RIFCSPLOWO2_12_FULL_43_20 TaxID=1802332 RepID=A0A1G2P448_9BACT|nr:MAG: hypothetical protein A2825_02750 [Candidatus Taylorbacteria bacterium RIFCSPHIGHO2_01_FULL_43_120]OHA23466.1 MAG: hypothetical protein A3B98_01305 [Candidatus Taylorbacteria bacterium RIFCSPHIGHO2_02_FULL_43_55]OHA29670.1 MAG: hypothetical protein A3E92_03610 [Candidatus Taylorbacteria bacterium RIFCSPHIGHO2_12_FULL_42_34]OHA31599.1 MAG: hypothetical protein A3B09_02705 [Candidatus Taylorbacteria bacterium RIFCSPLOWO2_01_FULL_43_83]OHA38979.1 MAG: hypothetical protein A3H58_00840 [Candi